VGSGGRQRVVLDREGREHPLDERFTSLTMSSSGQLDPYEELCHGHGRDRDVVIVGDRVLQTPPTPLGRNEDGGVQDQSFQPPLLGEQHRSDGRQFPFPSRIRAVAEQKVLDRTTGRRHGRGDARYRPPVPGDDEGLVPVLDGIENLGEVASGLRGGELGREIPLAGPSPVLGSERWRISRASSTG
jgi:hypothetical protein